MAISGEADTEGKAATGGEGVKIQGEAAIGAGGDGAGDRGLQPTGLATNGFALKREVQGIQPPGDPASKCPELPLRGSGAQPHRQISKAADSITSVVDPIQLAQLSDHMSQANDSPRQGAQPKRPISKAEDSLTSVVDPIQGAQPQKPISKAEDSLTSVVDPIQFAQLSDHIAQVDDSHRQIYSNEDIEKMKMRIQELEQLNLDLNQRLKEAEDLLMKNSESATRPDQKYDAKLNKCHDIFICPNESDFQKLETLLDGPVSAIIHAVEVKGRLQKQKLKELKKHRYGLYIPPHERDGKKHTKEVFKRLTPLGKLVILGIIEDIYRLHRRGFCLDGQFTLQSFFWTGEKKVKLDPALRFLALPVQDNRNGMIKDYHKIHQIILQMVALHGETIPSDLQFLLDLMSCEDPVVHEDIIRYNISLMTEIGKKSHFITLYNRWLQMFIRDSEEKKKDADDASKGKSKAKIYDSDTVLGYIPTIVKDDLGHEEEWSTRVATNEFVKRVYDVRLSTCGFLKLESPKDMLIIWRNALTHLLDDSVFEDIIEFFDEDIVHMLECAVPGVFNHFQKGMYAVGHGELPHLIRTMRM